MGAPLGAVAASASTSAGKYDVASALTGAAAIVAPARSGDATLAGTSMKGLVCQTLPSAGARTRAAEVGSGGSDGRCVVATTASACVAKRQSFEAERRGRHSVARCSQPQHHHHLRIVGRIIDSLLPHSGAAHRRCVATAYRQAHFARVTVVRDWYSTLAPLRCGAAPRTVPRLRHGKRVPQRRCRS